METVWASISALAAFIALLVSLWALRVSKDANARADARDLSDATSRAVVLRAELKRCRGALEIAMPKLRRTEDRIASLCDNRGFFELPTLRQWLDSLGCFDVTIVRSLTEAYNRVAQLHSLLPAGGAIPSDAEEFMNLFDVIYPDTHGHVSAAIDRLTTFLEKQPAPVDPSR